MSRKRPLAAAACLTMLVASPAAACSFSWAPGYSPQDIRIRYDVRMVRGTFRVGEARGEVGADGALIRGWVYGRIDAADGTHLDTIQSFDQFALDCAAYLAPTSDANGAFWIRRQEQDGRYELLLWEGQYLRRPEPQRQETTP